jgi:hypothetical protein
MEKKDKIQEKIVKIEPTKERFGALETTGLVAGPLVFNYYGKDAVRDVCEGTAQAVDALKTASQIFSVQNDDENVDACLELIDPNTAKTYTNNQGNYFEKFKDSTGDALEGMQRGALNLPGMESKPVTGLRGAKGWIIKKSKSLFTDDEEAEIQNDPNYTLNYNELGEYRLAARKMTQDISEEINDYCTKISVNESKGNTATTKQINQLEELVKSHNEIIGVVDNMETLGMQEIQAGVENPEYTALVGQAKDYGIKPYDSSSVGDIGVTTGFIAAAVIGYKLAKPIQKGVNTIAYGYNGAKKGISKIAKTVKSIKQKFK